MTFSVYMLHYKEVTTAWQCWPVVTFLITAQIWLIFDDKLDSTSCQKKWKLLKLAEKCQPIACWAITIWAVHPSLLKMLRSPKYCIEQHFFQNFKIVMFIKNVYSIQKFFSFRIVCLLIPSSLSWKKIL